MEEEGGKRNKEKEKKNYVSTRVIEGALQHKVCLIFKF
jgi:hypothetical protein